MWTHSSRVAICLYSMLRSGIVASNGFYLKIRRAITLLYFENVSLTIFSWSDHHLSACLDKSARLAQAFLLFYMLVVRLYMQWCFGHLNLLFGLGLWALFVCKTVWLYCGVIPWHFQVFTMSKSIYLVTLTKFLLLGGYDWWWITVWLNKLTRTKLKFYAKPNHQALLSMYM